MGSRFALRDSDVQKSTPPFLGLALTQICILILAALVASIGRVFSTTGKSVRNLSGTEKKLQLAQMVNPGGHSVNIVPHI